MVETKWLKRGLLQLAVLGCLAFGRPVAVFGQASVPSSVGPFHPAAIENVASADLESLLQMTETIQSFKPLFDYVNQVFADVRGVTSPTPPGGQTQLKSLQTDQIVYLLHNLPEVIPLFKDYSSTVTNDNLNDPKILAYREAMKQKFKDILKTSKVTTDVLTLDTPTEPLLIKTVGDAPAFSHVATYVNHPQLADPNNPKSKVLPADDLRELFISFIDGAKSSLMINIYEFNLDSIAQSLLRAKARGVDVIIGIDKNTFANGPDNQKVFDTLNAARSAKFKVVAVDPVGINHQKLIVRDVGTTTAQVLYSSGNFTQSCLGPEGDLVNIPADKRPAFSRPNANHAIIIDSPLMAMVTKYELRKTLVEKLRGRQYPTSGSFVFTGPVDGQTGIKDFAMLAFSPNGGTGDINRDISKRVILASHGPIWDMAFAFSSQDVSDAIKEQARLASVNHTPFDLKTIGDTSFAMRPWSQFLALSGYAYDDTKQMYVTIQDPNGLQATLGQAAFSRIQSQIRVNPNMFGDRNIKIDGVSYPVTVKLHHKAMGFPEMGWAFMGKSFNDSESAEHNQEQIILVGERSAVTKIQGAFVWLYRQAPQSVATYAQYRNANHIQPTEQTGDDDGADNDKEAAAAKAKKSKPANTAPTRSAPVRCEQAV